MKPLVYATAFLLSLWAGLAVAGAFEPWNVRNWPGTTPASSPMVTKVGQTSVMTWEAVDEYGWNGWRDVAARSLNSGSTDADSLANALNRYLARDNRGQIEIREARSGEVPDMRQYAVSTAFMQAKCGGDWATACVYLLNARPVPAYYKAAAMLTWPYQSQAAVLRHESFHALARACDQYRGGCPRATDGVWESAVVCTGNPDTLMDCGGAARTVTEFDYQTFVFAYEPGTSFLQIQQPVQCESLGYDPCTGRWKMPDGFSYDPVTGEWYAPDGRLEWSPCNADRIRWNALGAWFPPGSGFFVPSRNFWSFAPSC